MPEGHPVFQEWHYPFKMHLIFRLTRPVFMQCSDTLVALVPTPMSVFSLTRQALYEPTMWNLRLRNWKNHQFGLVMGPKTETLGVVIATGRGLIHRHELTGHESGQWGYTEEEADRLLTGDIEDDIGFYLHENTVVCRHPSSALTRTQLYVGQTETTKGFCLTDISGLTGVHAIVR